MHKESYEQSISVRRVLYKLIKVYRLFSSVGSIAERRLSYRMFIYYNTIEQDYGREDYLPLFCGFVCVRELGSCRSAVILRL